MSTLNVIIVVVAALLPLSAIAASQMQRRIQPSRLELARRGEQFLRRDDLNEDTRYAVHLMLDTAFGMRWRLGLIFLAVPFLAVGLVFDRRLRNSLARSMKDSEDPAYKALDALHVSITLANSPLLVPFVAVWCALWVAPALGLARLFDDNTPTQINDGDVARFVDKRTHRAHLAAYS